MSSCQVCFVLIPTTTAWYFLGVLLIVSIILAIDRIQWPKRLAQQIIHALDCCSLLISHQSCLDQENKLKEIIAIICNVVRPILSNQGVLMINQHGTIVSCLGAMHALFPDETNLLKPGESFAVFLDQGVSNGTFIPNPGETPDELRVRLESCCDEYRLKGNQWIRIQTHPDNREGSCITYQNITLSKQRENDLFQANQSLEAALKARAWREKEIDIVNARFDAALANMSQGLCMFDQQHCLILANTRFSEMFNIPQERLFPGLSIKRLATLSIKAGNHQNTSTPSQEIIDTIIGSKSGINEANIKERIIAIQRRPMPDGGFVATYEDITERRKAEERVIFMAHHDSLTGLANRVLFNQCLERAVADNSTNIAVLCLDLDRFKSVNDTYGHLVGDLLLKEVARRILSCVNAKDTVSRLGGDEFVVIQHPAANTEEIAAAICTKMAEPFQFEDVCIKSGTSIGICKAEAFSPREKIFEKADIALYRAKSAGRGVYCIFDQELDGKKLSL